MAKPGSEIVIVSPWISNVTLCPPIFDDNQKSTIRLDEMIARLALTHKIHFTILYRDRDYRLNSAIKTISDRAANSLTLRKITHLHAKMIVTEAFALEMSANLLWTSLYRNVESCTLLVNKYRNARQYVEAKLSLVI